MKALNSLLHFIFQRVEEDVVSSPPTGAPPPHPPVPGGAVSEEEVHRRYTMAAQAGWKAVQVAMQQSQEVAAERWETRGAALMVRGVRVGITTLDTKGSKNRKI